MLFGPALPDPPTTSIVEVTPPLLHGPTSKERKYDRQLRLWAANGQAALEESHILLINSGSGVAGIEALKNLVLPGIGRFTILDPATVTEEDLGVNFFLSDDDIGQSRAKQCSQHLEELNPDVAGGYIVQTAGGFLGEQSATQLAPFTLVIVTLPLPREVVENISNHSQHAAVPIVYIHSVGFYSHFTVQLPFAFPIVDTHPDLTSITDLRLLNPWPELSHLARRKTEQLDMMDDEQHGHVPYLFLLLHYLDDWKADHNGQVPQNYKEKAAFRELIRKGARMSNPEGGEENFDEAIAAVLKSLNPPTLSNAVKEVFEASECRDLISTSDEFWIIAHAISDFFQEHSVLPLPGSVPDMKAKSAEYMELQNAYKAKAREDVHNVMHRVRALETTLQRASAIGQREVEAFCKSASSIKLVRGRDPHIAKAKSVVRWGDRAAFAVELLQNPDSLILLYIAFLAYDSYVAIHRMVDHTGQEWIEPVEGFDRVISKMTGIAYTFVDALISESGTFLDDFNHTEVRSTLSNIVEELVRAGSIELHNVAAITGGAVAQEVIKIITKQYVPVDNIFLFDGITSRTSVLRL